MLNIIINGGSPDEHKVLTELACAATLTPAYEPRLMIRLGDFIPAENGLRNAVFIYAEGSRSIWRRWTGLGKRSVVT